MGSLAGITTLLSVAGFLSIRSYFDLLGISELVPLASEQWTIEGARFAYNSLFYLFAGIKDVWVLFSILVVVFLIVIIYHKAWFVRIQKYTTRPIIRGLLISGTFFGLLFISMYFLRYEAVSNLLTLPPPHDNVLIIRSHQAGMEQLRLNYVHLEVLLLLFYVWLLVLPTILNLPVRKMENDDKSIEIVSFFRWSSWFIPIIILWIGFVTLLMFLPMNYGKMVKEPKFLKVRLIKSAEQTQPNPPSVSAYYEGWLLHKNQDEIVLYHGTKANEPITIFPRDEFAQIQILELQNIFVTH